MTRLLPRFPGSNFRLPGILQSRERLEVSFGVLFVLALGIGTALWDEVAFSLAPANPAGWTIVSVSAALCVVFFALSPRRWPLLLCAAFLISVRLTFVLAELVPADAVMLTADCLGVCTTLSVIVFRSEITSQWRRLGGKSVSAAQPAVAAGV
jgi:hypothetical protein